LALEVRTREAFPKTWAAIWNNLGSVYFYRIRGERAENLERAIEHLALALEVRTREAYPEDWAMTQTNLGNAHAERIPGDPAPRGPAHPMQAPRWRLGHRVTRRELMLLLIGAMAAARPVSAQQKAIPVIGYLRMIGISRVKSPAEPMVCGLSPGGRRIPT
jgi:hypothetical protein